LADASASAANKGSEPADATVQTAEDRRRIGLNEAMFREVNERISELAEGFNIGVLDAVCECGDAECFDRIRIPHADYAALRADPLKFAVVPGHELPDVEHVVEERQGYLVIAKDPGIAAQVAREVGGS
jgi:hypothetical protein